MSSTSKTIEKKNKELVYNL